MASHTLDITSNTIKYGERVYAVRNITHIDVQVWKRKPQFSGLVLLSSGALLLSCMYYPIVLAQIYQNIAGAPLRRDLFGLLIIFLLLVCGYGLWERTRLKFYTLLIETSGRTASLFSSRDRSVIVDVADKIQQAMEDRSNALSYHVNIGDVINTNGNDNRFISRTTMGDSGSDH